MSHDFEVGMLVRAKSDVWEGADDFAPAGIYAKKGDLLIVRNVRDEGMTYPISVSHEHVTDRSFGVKPDEIFVSLLDDQTAKQQPPTEAIDAGSQS